MGVALDRILAEWLAREPNNPYVALFAPLMIEDDAQLRAQAPALWRTVQEAPVSPAVRDLLSHVLEFWCFEGFRGLTAREIWAMLNLVTPIQETRAYQSIFAEGKAEGKVEGFFSLLGSCRRRLIVFGTGSRSYCRDDAVVASRIWSLRRIHAAHRR